MADSLELDDLCKLERQKTTRSISPHFIVDKTQPKRTSSIMIPRRRRLFSLQDQQTASNFSGNSSENQEQSIKIPLQKGLMWPVGRLSKTITKIQTYTNEPVIQKVDEQKTNRLKVERIFTKSYLNLAKGKLKKQFTLERHQGTNVPQNSNHLKVRAPTERQFLRTLHLVQRTGTLVQDTKNNQDNQSVALRTDSQPIEGNPAYNRIDKEMKALAAQAPRRKFISSPGVDQITTRTSAIADFDNLVKRKQSDKTVQSSKFGQQKDFLKVMYEPTLLKEDSPVSIFNKPRPREGLLIQLMRDRASTRSIDSKHGFCSNHSVHEGIPLAEFKARHKEPSFLHLRQDSVGSSLLSPKSILKTRNNDLGFARSITSRKVRFNLLSRLDGPKA